LRITRDYIMSPLSKNPNKQVNYRGNKFRCTTSVIRGIVGTFRKLYMYIYTKKKVKNPHVFLK